MATQNDYAPKLQEKSDSEVTLTITDGVKNEWDEINLKENGGKNNISNESSKDFLGVPMARTGHRMSVMEEESAKERNRIALLKQCSAIFRQRDERFTKESLHKLFQDEFLLERIFQLFDVDRIEHLVQEDWIEFLKERLGEDKQLDFVEQVESVAYVLCGDGVITLPHFKTILKNKVVTIKLFRVVDTDGDGSITADEIMEFLSAVTSSRPRSGFDRNSVDQLEQLFKQTVGDQKEITRDQFQKIVVSKNPFFTERVFQIFDEDDSGTISLREFIAAVHSFAGQSQDDKIRFLFRVYDLDGDGLIQHRELQDVMRACMHENGMTFSEQQLRELTTAMFEDADVDQRGAITFEAFRDQLAKHGGLLDNLTISIDRWLVPPKKSPQKTSIWQRLYKLKPYQLSLPYFKNNYVLVIYLVVFFLVNVGLFVERIFKYWDSNGFVIVARACGQCLNLTSSWVLVLMLRGAVTWLRARGCSSLLPLDHHVYLHKLTGIMLCGYSVLHTIMHVCNFSLIVVNDPVINEQNFTTAEWLLTSKPGKYGLIAGCANPTGVALVAILLLMVLCSQPAIRRRGSFEVFYWTHLLYVPFWILLVLHAPNFWKWFLLPAALYVTERGVRLAWLRSNRGRTYISSGLLLPSRVTHLVVRRPAHFSHSAGDYVFVNVPAIARYEWHPFTISSAPEQEDYIWLHVRGVGEWTNRLYEYFEQQQARLHHRHDENTHGKVSRTTSGQSIASKKKKRSVDFSPEVTAYNNDDHSGEMKVTITSASPPSTHSSLKLLEKSYSMPNVRKGSKAKQGLMAYQRSESERSFDVSSCTSSPPASPASPAPRDLQKAYRSPHNKALAHSFRYMRNKPTIIAFKTPSMEDCERRRSNESIITLARRRLSKTISPDKDVEPAQPTTPHDLTASTDDYENYPVGLPLEIYVDGPYGAASSHIFHSSHAALVAAGIGVTPFASILQSVMYRYWRARNRCPNCRYTWSTDLPANEMALKKVDFFWINREQQSFEWFVSLLSQLEIEQAENGGSMDRFLDMHMYITSALQRTDMKAVGLQLALDLLHEKEKRDLITGLKTRTTAGRPNWDKVFQQLQQQNKGKITVFFCGPPRLARVLRIKCDQFGFEFRKEVF